jgi:O-acetyl-ADP-ribose deacetylase (regulator of RNase III)
MAVPINIFICYKKFLSYVRGEKTIEQENVKAEILEEILEQLPDRYLPWMDKAKLVAGMEWETEIYRRLLLSDVLLLLIGPGTSKSEWVKREIALANALGISVVPIGNDIDWQNMERELKALDVYHLQGKITQNISLKSRTALLSEIHDDLVSAAARTSVKQENVLRELLDRRRPSDPKAPDKQCAATFQFKTKGRAINLYVASGDISKIRDVDVLVNSENNYMQMARFFDSNSVSSMLRRLGARIRERDGNYEDTIQQELDWQLDVQRRGRPVQAADVFITSSGGPNSELAKHNRAKYILHVAAVQAVDAESTVIPFRQPYQIEACVRASLTKISALNKSNGVISRPGTDQYDEQKKRAEAGDGVVRSVVFPLFGTGQGGSPTGDVLPPMFAGLKGFFDDREGEELAGVLTDIYISAFKQTDVVELTEFLQANTRNH